MASTSKNVQVLSKGNHFFSCKLYKCVVEENSNGNVCFSPFSLSTVLAMVLAGARDNTAKQILEGLGFEGLDCDLHSLIRDLLTSLTASGTTTIANAVFIQDGFKPLTSFVELLSEMYSATAKNVDFNKSSALDEVNNWVKNATKEKIPKLLDEINDAIIMILLNAVHFKAFWEKKFEPEYTKDGKFFLNKNNSVNVKLMHQSGKFKYVFNEAADCEIVEIPYQDDQTSMLIFLPKKVDGLSKIENLLSYSFLENAVQDVEKKRDLLVWLPSFKLEESYSLSKLLTNMGMSDLFSPGRANLLGISGNSDLYASDVIHKSFIEVNEEGTKAAAVSAALLARNCAPPRRLHFRADHPFLFCILEKSSKHILFLGCLKKPEAC